MAYTLVGKQKVKVHQRLVIKHQQVKIIRCPCPSPPPNLLIHSVLLFLLIKHHIGRDKTFSLCGHFF